MRVWALTILLAGTNLQAAAPESPTPAVAAPTYADLADLALTAPVAAHVRVRRAAVVPPARSTGMRAGDTRHYVEADIVTLIRSGGGLPARVAYLVDIPAEPGGRAGRLRKKDEFVLLAAPVPGRPGELRLVARDAQLRYSPALAQRLRAVLQEAARADAPPAITGIGRAFHVTGALAGESETQIFLQAAGGRPVSLSILRRPGAAPRWAVALTEIVDEAAATPQRETLLWYRLACGLPRALPEASLPNADPAQADAVRADYRVVLDSLGPCGRTRAGAQNEASSTPTPAQSG